MVSLPGHAPVMFWLLGYRLCLLDNRGAGAEKRAGYETRHQHGIQDVMSDQYAGCAHDQIGHHDHHQQDGSEPLGRSWFALSVRRALRAATRKIAASDKAPKIPVSTIAVKKPL